MNFAEPAVLCLGLCAIPVLLLAWRSRAPLPRWQLRTIGVLQTFALLAAVIAVAGPWTGSSGPVHRVVVWGAAADANAAAAVEALRAEVPYSDPFVVVRAGSSPRAGLPGDPAIPAGDGAPDLSAALQTAALTLPEGARAQVVLCSDGHHDGAPLAAAADELVRRGVPVLVRDVPAPAPAPLQLQQVAHPLRTGRGEAFRLVATIEVDAAGPARLEVRDGEQLVGAADVQLAAGHQERAVDVVVTRAGTVALDVRLLRAGESPEAAARERSAVFVDDGLRVLHLAADPSRREALAAALRGRGVTTVAPDPAAPLDARALDAVAAVLVDDLPATAWPAASQQALRDRLLASGTGLVLAGTHQNLGPGGYAASPLQDVLPVRMPQREERRDPSVSLVLIVDTSGSMGGGRLELAKEVARLAIQKLQPHDKVGLIEFHGSKRWAAPLQPATNTIEITRALNRLQVGGGTIIYDALEEGYFALLNAQTRFQHVLVLTDGGVESGPFEELSRRMAQAGQTISTVLIGPLANSPFLISLAQWGRGRFYACPDKFQLPDLQFREPQSSLLPSVQERSVPLRRTGEAEATAAFAGDELPPSGGIVEASVRPGAEVLLRGRAGEPYLIGWDQGAGRALVLAGQAVGPQSGELHDDPGYAAFLADLLRSAAGGAGALVPQLRATPRTAGAALELELPPGAHLPAPPSVRCGNGAPVSMVWNGALWTAVVPWTGDAAVTATVTSGEVVLATGALCRPLSRAARAPRVDAELGAIAVATGGNRAALGTTLPEAPPARAPQVVSRTGLFAAMALVAFLAGLLLRRVPLDRVRFGAPAAGRVALLFVVFAGVGAGLTAQHPVAAPAASAPAAAAPAIPAADDEAGVRAAIDAELRDKGDLSALAVRWQDAPPLHRYWLARATGDLATAARLCAEPALAATHRDVRVQMLDLLGRPQEALAAFGEPAANLPGAERGALLLRRAVLQVAAGDRTAAAADLQAAVAAANQRAFAQQAGVIAATFGFFDLALQWHEVPTEPGREAVQAAFRRALWQQRSGRPAAAALEYELAYHRATMQRDRLFALAMEVSVHRRAGTLAEFAEALGKRAAGTGTPLEAPELQVLVEVLRELGRPHDALAVIDRQEPAVRAQLGDLPLSLAVEAGEPQAAIVHLRQHLTKSPGDSAARCSLAVLLADRQMDADAATVLREGLPGARARDLRRLCATASELGADAIVHEVAAAIDALAAAGGEAAEPIEGALLEIAHLRRQGKDAAAVALLLQLRDKAQRAQDLLRLAEQLESLGRPKEATELYRRIWEQSGTEDTGMRLAWLLGESKDEAERKEAQAIYRKVWTQAGSAARRVQAEEHVLDLAAREGNLADLALELEAQVADPKTPNRPAVRDALIKIYTRARDTTGAATILQRWAKEEPAHEIEALQQLSRVYLSAEEFRAHERALQRLIELDPQGELDYRQQLAMSALERGRPEDARKHIRGLLGKPGTPDTIALEFGAGIYTLAAMHEEAVRLYRRALALHPERVETFLLLGNALRAAGQRDAAIGTFEELLLRPLPDDLFVVAVDGLLNMDAPAPVLSAAARAVRLRLAARPEQVFLHRVLQDLLEATKDEAGRLLALEDTLTAAGEQRTNFVRELMQEAESRRDWAGYTVQGRTLLMLGDEVPAAVYMSLGEALLHTGEIDAAARAFERARLGTDFAAIEARTAELYENVGRLAEAERLRIRLLRRTPEEPGALLAVARLAERQGALQRALPNWLAAASKLLPKELEVVKAAPGRRTGLVMANNREKTGPGFGEPFAGVLRCAQKVDELGPLLAAIRAAATDGPPERRLVGLRLLRHLDRAFPEAQLAAELRAGEDALLAKADEATRAEIRSRRFVAGDLAGARAVPAGSAPTGEELRAVLLAGDPQALAFAASKSKPAQLPELARTLLLLGRTAEAEALLPLVEQGGEAAAGARDELRGLLGLPVVKDPGKARQKLEQALSRGGTLLAKVNAVCNALREIPDLPAGEKRAHVETLAGAVIAAKDGAAAERLLANARAELDKEPAAQLLELSFAAIDKPYMLSSRSQFLDLVPTERAVELVRSVLKKWNDEDRRMQLLQLFGAPQVPDAVLLALLPDCDPRGVQGSERYVFTNGLEKPRATPVVLKALAERFAATVPDDPLTALLQVRATEGAAQRQAALDALTKVATRVVTDRDETIVTQLVRFVGTDDAKALLPKLPAVTSPAVRIPLLVKAGDKAAAAAAYLAAYEAKPDDTGLLYRAASFFEGEGMFDRAAALYRTAQKTSPTFYPYQAQQLATLELRAGNPAGALAALRAARDPSQTNFRLVLRVLAEVKDDEVRRAALADALQQRAAHGGSSSSYVFLRALGGGAAGVAGDRLAAVLAPVRMPPLAPKTPDEADDAPSDLDLLAFLPEGEAAARTMLRTMDDTARANDPGIYRGLLGAAARTGHADAMVAEASARLAEAPADAEAHRLLFAAAQLGLALPEGVLAKVLEHTLVEPKLPAATVASLITLAAAHGDAPLAGRVLRSLVQHRAGLADMELRPWLPGLFAMACRQMPDLVLQLARDPGLDSDASADLAASVLLDHPDPAAAAAAVAPPPVEPGAERHLSYDGSDLLPRMGALLMRGDADAAAELLQLQDIWWMAARMIGARRFAAGVPPLARWAHPEAAAKFGERLLAMLPSAEDERLGVLARVGAVLVARLREAGQTEAAAALRQKLLSAAAAAPWRVIDWLPE